MQQEKCKNEKKLHFWVDKGLMWVYYKSVPNMQRTKGVIKMPYMQDMVKVKSRMAELNMTQGKLATILGISNSSMGRKLKGETEYTLSEALTMCEALGFDLSDIFFTDSVPNMQH